MHYATNTKPVKPKVGIMGLGLIGSITASKLRNMGYEVCGGVKTSRPRFAEVYVGLEEIDDFAKQCEVIVCQLPLTEEMRGILNRRLFSVLPDGAYLISVGRGAHVVEDNLLLAIETGKLSGASLDVFEIEPLPVNHPFQAIPQITITPHIAGYVGTETQAPYAAEVINN